MSNGELMRLDIGEAERQARCLTEQVQAALTQANRFEVKRKEDCEAAANLRNTWKSRAAEIDGARKRLKEPVLEAGRRIDALFMPPIRAYKRAADILGGKVSEYIMRVQEERRKEQEREERKADMLRREALEKAHEAAARAYEARQRAKEAEDEKERLKALRMAEREERKAEMYEEKAATIVAKVVPTKPQLEGVGIVERWVGEVTDMKAFVLAAKDHPEIVPHLKIDQSSLNLLARTWRDLKEVPGFRAKKVTSTRAKGVSNGSE